ncbi:MAG: AbrB/MazE/SpoVT family DNA-binding domain-containing protein [Armatimonadetes bacterium]|nr:AbrB/MazE/SpoVT family DNA-binding domain-containing protein [Armatimonadota bacterium]
MPEVILSSKYQMVIPKEIRERLRLKAGQRVLLLEKGGMIHIVPSLPLKSLRGTLTGLNLSSLRDEEDRI